MSQLLTDEQKLTARREHAARERDLLVNGSAHDWAVEWCCGYLISGWRPEHIIAEACGGAGPSGGGYWYEVRRGKMLITEWHGKACKYSFSMRLLVEEAQAQLAGVPQQAALFPIE